MDGPLNASVGSTPLEMLAVFANRIQPRRSFLIGVELAQTKYRAVRAHLAVAAEVIAALVVCLGLPAVDRYRRLSQFLGI